MKSLLTRLVFFSGCLIYLTILSNTSGAPAGATGAPGEGTCARSGCHDSTSNFGEANISLRLDNGATAYVPGNMHTISVSIDNPQEANRNGFEIVALDAQNNNIGNWNISGEYLRLRSANGRDYVTHSEDGSVLTAWNIGWQAPLSNVGRISFFVAVNDANDNLQRTGDIIYTTSARFSAEVTSAIKTISSIEDIAVFPNPIKTQINIKINLTTATNLSGTLVNSTGQSIVSLFHRNLPMGVSNLSTPFPIGSPIGYYFLRLESKEGGIKSIPLLKM